MCLLIKKATGITRVVTFLNISFFHCFFLRHNLSSNRVPWHEKDDKKTGKNSHIPFPFIVLRDNVIRDERTIRRTRDSLECFKHCILLPDRISRISMNASLENKIASQYTKAVKQRTNKQKGKSIFMSDASQNHECHDMNLTRVSAFPESLLSSRSHSDFLSLKAMEGRRKECYPKDGHLDMIHSSHVRKQHLQIKSQKHQRLSTSMK